VHKEALRVRLSHPRSGGRHTTTPVEAPAWADTSRYAGGMARRHVPLEGVP
jgi:hypothetical protein